MHKTRALLACLILPLPAHHLVWAYFGKQRRRPYRDRNHGAYVSRWSFCDLAQWVAVRPARVRPVHAFPRGSRLSRPRQPGRAPDIQGGG